MPAAIEQLREMSQKIDALFVAGKKDEGQALLQQALDAAQETDEAYALFFRGEMAGYLQDDRKEQERLFTQALDLRPADFFLLRNLGISLSKVGQMDQALSWFDKALEINPKDFDSMRQRGVSLSNFGREEEALSWFDKALEIKPKDYRTMRERGASLSRLGRMEDALPWLDKALAIKAEDESTWYWKAKAELDLNRLEAALASAAKAVELAPADTHNLSLYNLISARLGTPAKLKDGSAPASTAPLPLDKDIRDEKKPSAESVQKGLLLEVVRQVQKTMGPKVDQMLKQMQETEQRRLQFLEPVSKIRESETLFLALRKWNSYTPIIPDAAGERHVGGGYFIFVQGRGTVIDPGHNFIENLHSAGFNIHDVHNIVITHAHNDHTADLESLLTLAYEYNDGIKKANEQRSATPKDLKSLNLYLNTGTFLKFSGVLNLRRSKHIGCVHTLMRDHEYDLGQGLTLRGLPAYHDEIVTKDYATGVALIFKSQDGQKKRIVITSDTCLLPSHPSNDGVDPNGTEIWQTYRKDAEKDAEIDLLVAHIGSIQQKEFEDPSHEQDDQAGGAWLAKLLYKNHLGIIGTVRVITSLRPRLALISEFGEELAPVQKDLIELTNKAVTEFCDQTGKAPIKVMPADTSFVYRVWDETAYCIYSKAFVPVGELKHGLPNEKAFTFYYRTSHFAKDTEALTNFSIRAEEFEKARRERKPGWLYFK